MIPSKQRNDLFTWGLVKPSLLQHRQVTLQDTVGSYLDIKTSYTYKKKVEPGYEEYGVPGFKEKVFIPIQLKSAIETVFFCGDDIIQSTETTPVREVDKLYRKQLEKGEFILVLAGTTLRAVIGVVDNNLTMQPIIDGKNSSAGPIFLTKDLKICEIKNIAPLEAKEGDVVIPPNNTHCYDITTGEDLASTINICVNRT